MNIKEIKTIKEDLKRYELLKEQALVNYMKAVKGNESEEEIEYLERTHKSLSEVIKNLELLTKRR